MSESKSSMIMFNHLKRMKKFFPVDITKIVEKLIKMIQFGIVGGTMLILNIVILFVLTSLVGIYYIISAIISCLLLTGLSFYLNENWTFSSVKNYTHKKMSHRIVSYYIVSFSGICLNIIILFLLTDYGNVYYLYSSIIASFLVYLWNFSVNEKITWCGK
jgi:putative flippase GtrA